MHELQSVIHATRKCAATTSLGEARTPCPQVLAFNMGSLGFLTNHLYRNYRRDAHNVINGCESLGQCSLPEENVRGPSAS